MPVDRRVYNVLFRHGRVGGGAPETEEESRDGGSKTIEGEYITKVRSSSVELPIVLTGVL